MLAHFSRGSFSTTWSAPSGFASSWWNLLLVPLPSGAAACVTRARRHWCCLRSGAMWCCACSGVRTGSPFRSCEPCMAWGSSVPVWHHSLGCITTLPHEAQPSGKLAAISMP